MYLNRFSLQIRWQFDFGLTLTWDVFKSDENHNIVLDGYD